MNTDSWSTMQAQQIVYKTIVDKSNKKHIANKDVSADILNYVERTKIKTSLKFKQVLKCNETLRNYIRHKKLHF